MRVSTSQLIFMPIISLFSFLNDHEIPPVRFTFRLVIDFKKSTIELILLLDNSCSVFEARCCRSSEELDRTASFRFAIQTLYYNDRQNDLLR